MSFTLALMGMWLLSDAIYSITLYLNAPTYDDNHKQTWRKDHWVRAVRGCLAIGIIIMAWILWKRGL